MPLSARDINISPGVFGHRADMGRGLIWDMIWKLTYIIYLSYIFSFWQVCLFDIVLGLKGKIAVCSECGDMGFAPGQKSAITHVTRWYVFVFFLPGKKKPYQPRDLLHSTRVICAWKPCEYHICKMNIFSSTCMISHFTTVINYYVFLFLHNNMCDGY